MSIWKEIDGKIASELQQHFFEEGCRHWASGGEYQPQSPSAVYVYANQDDLVQTLGIDTSDLSSDQEDFGPLAHLEELNQSGLSKAFSDIIPQQLSDKFFISRTSFGEVILVCDERVKDYQPS